MCTFKPVALINRGGEILTDIDKMASPTNFSTVDSTMRSDRSDVRDVDDEKLKIHRNSHKNCLGKKDPISQK